MTRERERFLGVLFVKKLRKRFGNRDTSSPFFDGVEVVAHGDQLWFVQRHQGHVVGGGYAMNGERRMIAGGEVVGSPVSVRPVYEAMNARRIKPSTLTTSYGREAQENYHG
jgi:hypothetical protein